MKIIDAIKSAAHAFKATFSLTGDTLGSLRFTFRGLLGLGGLAPEYKRLATLATRNPHSARGLRLIAQLMSSVGLYIEERNADGDWETPERHEYGWLLEIIDRPGRRTSREMLFDLITIGLYAGGEFWLDKTDAPLSGPNAGRPAGLRIIMPDEFEDFIRDETDEITGYRFRTRRRGRRYDRTVEDCLHVRLPDPLDNERGLPILVAGQALTLMQAATTWNESIAQGGGRVPGYWAPQGLERGEMLDPTKVKQAEEMLNRRSREAALNNAEMVLAGNLKRESGDVSPKDADWSKGLEFALRQIATLLGVPHTLLGGAKQGSLTDSGVDSEVRATYLLTVLPLLERVLTEFSRFFLPAEYRLWYDRDQIEALSEDTNAMWERYSKAFQARLITRDEARNALNYDEATPEQIEELKPANPFMQPEPGGDGAMRSISEPILKLGALPEDEFERMFN